jgi:predicted membrane protein
LLGIANFAVWGLVGKLLVSAEETHRRWAAFLWIAKLTFFFGGLVLLLSAFPIAAVTVGVLVMLLAILIEALASPQRLIAVEEA